MIGKKKINEGHSIMTNKNTANVVDGKLILSFLEAVTPVVWQMDIEKAASCALEVQEDKKRKLFVLAQKTDEETQVSIATFESKADAVNALMATSAALQSAHGKIKASAVRAVASNDQYPAAPVYREMSTSAKDGDGKKAGVIAIFLVVVLLSVWFISISTGNIAVNSPSGAAQRTHDGAPTSAGVAQSADDFLSKKQ